MLRLCEKGGVLLRTPLFLLFVVGVVNKSNYSAYDKRCRNSSVIAFTAVKVFQF